MQSLKEEPSLEDMKSLAVPLGIRLYKNPLLDLQLLQILSMLFS